VSGGKRYSSIRIVPRRTGKARCQEKAPHCLFTLRGENIKEEVIAFDSRPAEKKLGKTYGKISLVDRKAD